MDIDFFDFTEEAKSFAKSRGYIVALSFVFSVVLFPAIESTILSNYSKLSNVFEGKVVISFFVFILFLHAATGFAAYLTSNTEEFYFDFLEVRENLKKEKDKSELLYTLLKESEYELESSVAGIKSAMNFVAENKNSDIEYEDLKEGIRETLSFAIEKRSEVFDFNAKSKHNFAVYLYNEEDDILECTYRYVDDRISTKNRNWEPGEGHVGLCFQRNETIISPDVLDAPLLTYSLTESDRENYRSMASTPLVVYENSGTAEEPPRKVGVLIVTSSRPDQLKRSRHESTMLILGATLSILLSTVELTGGGILAAVSEEEENTE
jgi:hypothetical protein